jgi:serine/threonine protein phosphatase PrpC
MTIIPGNAQRIGARAEQQDAFGFSNIDDRAFVRHGGVLAIVADGMGGMANGRDASMIAVRTMLASYEAKGPEEDIPQALHRSITAANRAVYEFSSRQGKTGGVGTTLAAVVIKGDDLHWVSAGDSRIYLLRGSSATQISSDHVYARDLRIKVARREMSAEQAQSHPERDALTSFLGDPEIPEIDRSVAAVRVMTGDRLLLCSDGLYRAVSEPDMARIAMAGHPAAAAEALVDRAIAAGIPNQDNATAALLQVAPGGGGLKSRMLGLVGIAVATLALLAVGGWVAWSYLQDINPAKPKSPHEAATVAPQGKAEVLGEAMPQTPDKPPPEIDGSAIEKSLRQEAEKAKNPPPPAVEAKSPAATKPVAEAKPQATPKPAAENKPKTPPIPVARPTDVVPGKDKAAGKDKGADKGKDNKKDNKTEDKGETPVLTGVPETPKPDQENGSH